MGSFSNIETNELLFTSNASTMLTTMPLDNSKRQMLGRHYQKRITPTL